jgi:translation initiation factor eIF-2B subunit epsilon
MLLPLLCVQVELLLTLEEFCDEEGVFEVKQPRKDTTSTAGGAAFSPLFANLLQLLYDAEVVEEGAVTAWAAEKEHAPEEEKAYLRKVRVA